MSKLLTLDLSTKNVGYTIGEPCDEAFSSGAFHLPPTERDDIGGLALNYHRWLGEQLTGVGTVVFEAPLLNRQHDRLIVVRKLLGLCWHTEFVCAARGIECREAHVLTVRAFIGVQKVDGVSQKEQAMNCVRAWGFSPRSLDESDAIAVRLYVIHQMFPEEAKAFRLDLGLLGTAATSSAA